MDPYGERSFQKCFVIYTSQDALFVGSAMWDILSKEHEIGLKEETNCFKSSTLVRR